MAKLFDIKLTSANAPEALFTVYYNAINASSIASVVSNNNPAVGLTRVQLITGTGVRVAVPNSATSIIVYSAGCNTSVAAAVPDTIAPTPATNLTASAITQSTLTLTWGAGSDNIGVTEYLVYKDGVLLVTLGNVLTYDVSGLTSATAYTFTVYAGDAAGNLSVVSNTASATTAASSVLATSWDFNFSGSTDKFSTCSDPGFGRPLFTEDSYITINTIMYTSAGLDTVFNGLDRYWLCAITGTTYKIGVDGIVLDRYTCF